GLLVTGTNQQVGAIEGAGTTQINSSGNLTANRIVQAALVIGGDVTHRATVTISASDANGNPLNAGLGSSSTGSCGLALGASLPIVSLGPFLNASADGISGGITVDGSDSAVPEPSTLLLLAIGSAAGVLARLRRRAPDVQ